MGKISIRRRANSHVLVGTMADLDALAKRIQGILEREHMPLWHLRLAGGGDADLTGDFSESADALDTGRIRGLELNLGSRFDDRRATLEADTWGVRVDVWGESETWARDSVVRLRHLLVELRPWWWWLRTWVGNLLLGMTGALLIFALLRLIEAVTGDGVPYEIKLWSSFVAGIVAGLFWLFAVPTLRVAERGSGRARLRSIFWWVTGVVASAATGVLLTAFFNDLLAGGQ